MVDMVIIVDMVDPVFLFYFVLFFGLGPIFVLPCQKLTHSMLLSLNDTTVVC